MNVYLGELYKEVEYIQSNGTQRIDTGVNVSNDSTYGFELKCNFYEAREAVMDMGGDNSDVRRYGVQVGIGNWQISRPMYGTNNDYATFVYSPVPQTGVDYTMIYNYNGNGSWSLNGTTYASNLSVGSFTYNYNWNIFCQTLNNGTYTRYSKFKLYYMKIYHGTTLVRDFVPCYRVSDNVIGLFDKVENKFYTNAGTGTFTKGNDVKVFQPELKNDYIGEHYAEYNYTFQGKTIDQIYADGWTKVGNETPSIDSTGLTTNYAYLYHPLQFTFANSSKVVMEVNCKLGSSGSVDFVVGTTSSANSEVNECRVYNSYNNYNSLIIGGNNKGNFSHSSNGIITYTLTLDLEGKTATLVYSDGTTATPSSWSITDTEVANIRTNGYVLVVCGGSPRAITVAIKSY